jgi:threonine/homoserine/homoserine lactone efflux protein
MAFYVALGIMVGDMLFLLLAISGLAAVAELLGNFFLIVRYCGALYLIWLGYCAWTREIDLRSPKSKKATSPKSCLLSGLFVTLGNPKAMLFYLSFLPAFLDPTRLSSSDVLITMSAVIFTLAAVLLAYSYAANRFRVLFHSGKALKRINRCAGTAMISAGVAIAAKE